MHIQHIKRIRSRTTLMRFPQNNEPKKHSPGNNNAKSKENKAL